MTNRQCEMGIVGLGTMGHNLLLNMVDHGFTVAGYDIKSEKIAELTQEAKAQNIHATNDLQKFIESLRQPRAIMLLVTAGPAVDSVIQTLLPFLQKGDLIIDAGNSYFKDTDARMSYLNAKGILFLGVGVSGGEEGARRGPSIMPGGAKEAYERVRPVLEAVAAKVNNDPCVTYLGPGSVGHFVKMVHNGIEYGIMQLMAEIYDIMKRGLSLNDEQISNIFTTWNQGELNGYLTEITGQIFKKIDDKTQKPLINEIVAQAEQNGTGMWTSQSAMELQSPTPTIDMSVVMRDISVLTAQREQASKMYSRPIKQFSGEQNIFTTQLQHALYASMIITYAQGMALLFVASKKYGYQLDLTKVAKIWRGGCIIRAALLEEIATAFEENKDLPNLLLAPKIAASLIDRQESLRKIIMQSCDLGIPTPCLMTTLSYFDAYRSLWSPANLIQAQRDYFGSHTYKRIDAEGIFHTQWEPTK